MYCPNCGTKNDDDSLFCGECGEPLSEYQENADTQDISSDGTFENKRGDMFCPNCGKPVEKGASFCGNCGASINEPGDIVQSGTESGAKHEQGLLNSTAGRVLVGALAGCAIIGVIIGGVTLLNSNKSEPETMVSDELETQETEEASGPLVTQEAQEAQETQEPQGTQEPQETLETQGAQDTNGVQMIQDETLETQGTVQMGVEDSEYLVPDAATRYYSTSELSGLTKDQLRLARNEIYARHGRMFKDQKLQDYFNGLSWYNGTIQPDDFDDNSILNEYEKKNIETIKSLE